MGMRNNGDNIFRRVWDRILWKYAKVVGERPECECGNEADFYLSQEGYRCMMCYARGQPYQGLGYMRDLEPDDYFSD